MKRFAMTILLTIAVILLVTLMVVLKTAPPHDIPTVGSASALNDLTC
ncbi:conserved hypothetical protein [Paraburkholderia sacchari]